MLNFEFCGVGSQSVVVVASRRGGGSLLAEFKIKILAAGSGQNLNFEFCDVGSQFVGRSPSSRRRRRFSFKIQNSKFGRGERPNFEF